MIWLLRFPCGSAGKESACSAWDLGLIPGLRTSPGEGKGYPLTVFWPGEFYGLYSPWGHKELDMTERLSLHFTSLHFPMWTLVTWGNSFLVKIFCNQGAVHMQSPGLNIWGEYHLGRKVKDPLGGPHCVTEGVSHCWLSLRNKLVESCFFPCFFLWFWGGTVGSRGLGLIRSSWSRRVGVSSHFPIWTRWNWGLFSAG